MPVRLTDDEVARLIAERKPLPADYQAKMQVRPKRGHKERELGAVGTNGGEFRVILRQSSHNPFDFSAILAYLVPGTNQLFRLRRYNGKSHEHSNPIEKESFYDFHVHEATERYQEIEKREDTYATASDRFSDLTSAVACMVADCAFELPAGPQQALFGDI